MAKQKQDWVARITAIVSVLLSAFAVYSAYHWHQQEVEDRILVRVGAFQASHSPPNSTIPTFTPKGKLDVEIVNIGMRPIYIQGVELEMGSTGLIFYQHGPAAIFPSDATKPPLAPGQPVDYKMDWDFSEGSVNFMRREIKKNDLWVHVETTRRSFDVPVTNIYSSTNSFLNLELIQPPQK